MTVENKTLVEWEVVKPIPVNGGWNKPFLSINQDGKITFSKTAKSLLNIEEGGNLEIVFNRSNRHFYLVPRARKSSSTFFVPKSGKINDLALPDRLRIAYNMPADQLARLYLAMPPESYDSEKAYKLEV